MRKLIYIIIFVAAVSGLSIAQSQPAKSNSFAEINSGDEKFDRIFREARELIDKEEWKQAIEKFKQIICLCPDDNDKKQADAALYWMAYSYKKQQMFDEAFDTLGHLTTKFPKSKWASDAAILQMEVNRSSSRATAAARPTQTITGQAVTEFVPYYSSSGQTVLGTTYAPQQVPLDREDEFRLAAFQTLLAADTKRAIEVMGSEILRSDSKSSETLKREVLRSLRNSRFSLMSHFVEGYPITSSSGQQNSAENAERQQNTTLLRDTLFRSFKTESNSKIRSEIIYSIAGINDEPSFNYLVQLYSGEPDKELKKTIINSFGGTNSFYYSFSTSPVGQAIALNKAAAERTVSSTAQNTNPVSKLRFDKLVEIIRTEKDLELRRLALSRVQRFSGWIFKDGMVEMLSQMYDAESDEQFKSSIIQSFTISSIIKNDKQPNAKTNADKAVDKLINIAKNDKSDKLRLEAIRALREVKSPESLKFLEDLIKQN